MQRSDWTRQNGSAPTFEKVIEGTEVRERVDRRGEGRDKMRKEEIRVVKYRDEEENQIAGTEGGKKVEQLGSGEKRGYEEYILPLETAEEEKLRNRKNRKIHFR